MSTSYTIDAMRTPRGRGKPGKAPCPGSIRRSCSV